MRRPWRTLRGRFALLTAAAVALAVSAALHPATVRERLYPGRFPLACFDTLKTLPPGKVLNRFIMGGALSYFAGPEYKVLIDSRNDPLVQSTPPSIPHRSTATPSAP